MKTRSKDKMDEEQHNQNMKTRKKYVRYPRVCNENMTFGECELALLRHSIDKIERRSGSQRVKDPIIRNIINIVEYWQKRQ